MKMSTDQRYYASSYGRFNTPDPYQALANGASDPSTPQNWNKYAYVQGDPVNQTDRHGLYLDVDAGGDWDDCIDDDVCIDGPEQAGGGGGAVAPSCSISVATSGTPAAGQNVTNPNMQRPAPINVLGPFTISGNNNLLLDGWYYAVQIQGILSGDTNPADWTDY